MIGILARQPRGEKEGTPPDQNPNRDYFFQDYFLPPRRRPRPATVFLGPLRVRELVRVR